MPVRPHSILSVRPSVCHRALKNTVLHLKSSNFKFKLLSYGGRRIFFGFGKKSIFRKKIFKKPLKTGFFFKKDAVCNGFSISLAFWRPWVTRKIFFFTKISKSHFWPFWSHFEFFWYTSKMGGDQDFLYFVSIDGIS